MITKAEISFIRSLADKRVRIESGLFVVEGRKMVDEAIASNLKVRQIYGTAEFASVSGCQVVSQKDIERMSSLKTPQGIIATVEMPKRAISGDLNGKLTLALDGVQDPGNMGTIMRLADWFGIEHLLCSEECADCFNPKVVQATMGAIFRVQVHYLNLPLKLSELAASKVPIYGAFLEGENIYRVELGSRPGGVVVLGNEGRGISNAVAEHITHKLFIPPYPVGSTTSESLNVATATAIICSEFRRRE